MPKPLVLLDSPEDGYCESFGWVSDEVSEDEARDLLAQFCGGEDGDPPHRPTGKAKIVWLIADKNSPFEDEWLWYRVDQGHSEALAFWEIDVTE